jgi:hypothetical protein
MRGRSLFGSEGRGRHAKPAVSGHLRLPHARRLREQRIRVYRRAPSRKHVRRLRFVLRVKRQSRRSSPQPLTAVARQFDNARVMVVTARSGERQRFHRHVAQKCAVDAREAVEPVESLEDRLVRLVRSPCRFSGTKTSRRRFEPADRPHRRAGHPCIDRGCDVQPLIRQSDVFLHGVCSRTVPAFRLFWLCG